MLGPKPLDPETSGNGQVERSLEFPHSHLRAFVTLKIRISSEVPRYVRNHRSFFFSNLNEVYIEQ